MKNVLILGRRNGVGLDRDAELLANALKTKGIVAKSPKVGGLRALCPGREMADAAFHLERVSSWWRRRARVHFLIPNQERFPERQLGRLRLIDHILCKSRHAAEIFSRVHPSVHVLTFTSEDRLLPNRTPDYARFFHLAGRSTLKNTSRLLTLWENHPEWPVLTLVQHPSNAPAAVPANVNLISRYLPDRELRELQNSCGVHLCPSLSEGWGHYIAEAMSCRAVTVVTDAPPMNELIAPDRGIVVPYHHSEPRHLGRNYDVDPVKLETAIAALISQPASEKQHLGDAARHWFEANDRRFHDNLGRILTSVSPG